MTIRKRADRPDRWLVDVPFEGRRIRRLVDGDLNEARAVEKALEKAAESGVFYLSLHDCLQAYLTSLRSRAKHRSVHFAECHAGYLVAHFGKDANAAGLSPSEIDAFIVWRRSLGLSSATINGSLRVLKAATKFAVEERQLREAPTVKMLKEGHRIPSILTLDQVSELAAQAEANGDPGASCAVLLAAHAGLRHQEITHLKWSDVRGLFVSQEVWAAGRVEASIRVTPKPEADWSPKGYHEREIPLTRRLGEKLRAWDHHQAAWASRPDTWVFARQGRDRRPDFSAAVRQAFRDCELWDPAKKPGLHMLRRTFASTLLASGADLQTVMELGGWASLAVVQRYLASTSDLKKAAVASAFEG